MSLGNKSIWYMRVRDTAYIHKGLMANKTKVGKRRGRKHRRGQECYQNKTGNRKLTAETRLKDPDTRLS